MTARPRSKFGRESLGNYPRAGRERPAYPKLESKSPRCMDGTLTVIIPTWDQDPNHRGCPGSFGSGLGERAREVCPIKRFPEARQKQLCDMGADRVVRYIASTLSPGSMRVSSHGTWRNPDTGEIMYEKNIQVSTSFENKCVTKEAMRRLARDIDGAMQGMCQREWFASSNGDKIIYSTGYRRPEGRSRRERLARFFHHR